VRACVCLRFGVGESACCGGARTERRLCCCASADLLCFTFLYRVAGVAGAIRPADLSFSNPIPNLLINTVRTKVLAFTR
jgi:hypothetical protein